MKELVKNLLSNRTRTVPVLSFPAARHLGYTVRDFVTSSEAQAVGMSFVAQNYPVGAVMNMMDLSVEAEAFGAEIVFDDRKVPEVRGTLINDVSEIDSLAVPDISAGRVGVFAEGIRKAKKAVKDIPIICGAAGPYSLAGRLIGMTQLMLECFDSPDEVKELLDKCTCFITAYVSEMKLAGADGVLICEPSAGLISPDMAEEFSNPFIRRIFDAAGDGDFITGYHNCGPTVNDMGRELSLLNADIYHFGNAVDIAAILPLMPEGSAVMGNLDPLLLRNGSPEDVKRAVYALWNTCSDYPCFMLSSGCDIPADALEENLNAYFEAAGTCM